MKKVYLLTALSAIAIIGIFLPKVKAQPCSCTELMSGTPCCVTKMEYFNGCPVTYQICIGADTSLAGGYSIGITKLESPEDCAGAVYANFLDLQDSIIIHTLQDTSFMPSDSCWPGIPKCPNVICAWDVSYMTCYRKYSVYEDSTYRTVYEKCTLPFEPCVRVLNICLDETGTVQIYRDILQDTTCEMNGCESICDTLMEGE